MDESGIVSSLGELFLLLRLSRYEGDGTKKDFAVWIGSGRLATSNYEFVNKMVQTGILVPSSPLNIAGKIYQGYRVNKKRVFEVLVSFFRGLKRANPRVVDEAMAEIVAEDHIVL